MPDTPLVSVIIPCYNAERWVAEAIRSALDQTHPNVEVIVVDDGSTDGSVEILKTFGDRVHWETGPNRGACAARNRGVELSRGEYLQFLDADDLIHPEKLAIQTAYLLEDSGLVVGSALRQFEERPHGWGRTESPASLRFQGDEYVRRFLNGGLDRPFGDSASDGLAYFQASTFLIPRGQHAKVGGWDEGLAICQDSDYFLRITTSGAPVLLLSTPLVQYRTNLADSISRGRSRRHAESYLRFCQKVDAMVTGSGSPSEGEREKARVGLARLYFSFAAKFNGYADLVQIALKRLSEIDVPTRRISPNPRVATYLQLLGVRNTLRLLRLKGRLRDLRDSVATRFTSGAPSDPGKGSAAGSSGSLCEGGA